MTDFPALLPHGEIQEILPDVFFVKGQIRVESDPISEFSRNMIIIRDEDSLTLINTVRLNDAGLSHLDSLGAVRHLVKLGAFHGRDDAFYLDRYKVPLWAPSGMTYSRGEKTDNTLKESLPGPPLDAAVFVFDTPKLPEAALLLKRHSGILITCDSLQNMTGPDEYFNEHATESKRRLGFFHKATLAPGWLKYAEPKTSDLVRLKALDFRHLLSAHGEPLLDDAHQAVCKTMCRLFDL